MSASLVGSEMCIRDSVPLPRPLERFRKVLPVPGEGHNPDGLLRAVNEPVSYTHLTLPTICSV
eukprot:10339956-Alexandrium_andersonii.AAC.1